MRRHAPRDDRRDRIGGLPPGRAGHVGVTAKDDRPFVEAALDRYRAGIPRRDPPERFGDRKKVHPRSSRRARAGVWERTFEHLAGEADDEDAMLDSTIVRAHQRSAGAVKEAAGAAGRSGAAGAGWAPRSAPRSTRSATRPGSPSRRGRRTTSRA